MLVRPLTQTDRDQWQVLWKGYQEFYKTNLDEVTDSLWQRLFEDHAEGPVCLVAEEEEKAAPS